MTGNTYNDYQRHLGWYFDRIPKTVLAGIVVSMLSNGGDNLKAKEVSEKIYNEWKLLHENGIIPQRPIRPKESDFEI